MCLGQQAGPDVVVIIALISQHKLGSGNRQGDEVIDGFIVGGLATGEHKAKTASLTGCAGMDFARKTAAASTKAFRMPPLLRPLPERTPLIPAEIR